MQVLVGDMLVVEGDRGGVGRGGLKVREVVVVTEANVAEDLRRRGLAAARKHARGEPQLNGLGVHHAGELAVADDGDDGRSVSIIHAHPL